jgi:hypothetical protein
MKSPLGSISVGAVHAFDLLRDDGHCGVYRKTYRDGTGRVSYVIAYLPPLKAYTEPPASALMEFAQESEALRAFARWKEDRLLTQRVRGKKKRQQDSAQCELALGPFKNKAQLELDALRRRLGGGASQ